MPLFGLGSLVALAVGIAYVQAAPDGSRVCQPPASQRAQPGGLATVP
jgi:hypothetical protein